MYPFILSIILGVIVSLCIFKKDFWENRYVVLIIIPVIALVSMTTTNYILRGNLPKKVEIQHEKEIIPLYWNASDSIFNETLPYFGDIKRIPRTYELVEVDSLEQFKTNIIFYRYDTHIRVGWNADDKNRVNRRRADRTYFGVCDDNPRFEQRRLRYDTRHTNWVNDMSLPDIEIIRVLYITQAEFDALPEEYKREIPF